jgi:hypothetical protein
LQASLWPSVNGQDLNLQITISESELDTGCGGGGASEGPRSLRMKDEKLQNPLWGEFKDKKDTIRAIE